MSVDDKEYVATLVTGGRVDLDEPMVIQFTSLLRANDGRGVRRQWLRAGKAVDVFCIGLTPEKIYSLFKVAVPAQAFDIIVQPVATRKKKLLLADMESTIIQQEMLDEIAALLGMHDKVASITLRAMNGEIDFAAALRQRVGLLADQPATLLDEAAKCITFMPGAAELVGAMKMQGAQCWLVSGGFTCFTSIVAEKLGFDKVFANHLVVSKGRITGELGEPILDKNSKKQYLDQACAEYGISLADCLTVGDGANDIPMLNACNDGGGLGVAYHAKPAVRAVVPHQINYAGLSALIDAQDIN